MREPAASVLREGVAPFRVLLCRQVTGDEMSIDVFERCSSLLILLSRSNQLSSVELP